MRDYKTTGGVKIQYNEESIPYKEAIESVVEQLDSHRGAIFASSYDYPGRYTCWDIGFYNPPLMLTCQSNAVIMSALNERGAVLLSIITNELHTVDDFIVNQTNGTTTHIKITRTETFFSEEERSHQPSVFSVIRKILQFFYSAEESYLGIYGAFGYDLIFQFEKLKLYQEREITQQEIILYLPDEIYVVDHRKEEAFIRRYDFFYENLSTGGLKRKGDNSPYVAANKPDINAEFAQGEYAALVEKTKERFVQGDLFEVVLSQTFHLFCPQTPSHIFKQMKAKNPSPYGFFINLGKGEYLVGASPEMYVRVQGKRVETCPISGTIKRGKDAIEDALHIQELLTSAKEASELTMCTDVDRNDKSRICEAGSVKVIGRRQIEMYSRVIHTVDHVEGQLREGFDAVDAFLTHMWVVTVTGAPKLWAMQYIEEQEKSPRQWYGGAVGWFGFNGDLNTGLILRTFHINNGIASIRVGATLLYDSIPEAEEEETRLKASAFLEILNEPNNNALNIDSLPHYGQDKKILLIDHQDSFVHTLANYFRQTGAEVITIRYDLACTYLTLHQPDLIVLSPGPGRPNDFNLQQTITEVLKKKIPIFGVCLGLQAIVEYFGGELAILPYPMHGKPSTIKVMQDHNLFSGLGKSFTAGRYHSLYAIKKKLPTELITTAESEDGIIMAISHKSLPIHAVQFHPETILSLHNNVGLKIINNMMRLITNHA
ncbi:anthranilate synthase (glutamine amidotransferase) component I (plasmid) [Legionella adelaidensis]|uniref:Anthranilate synthase n=1 Tax=Legionella adelaidensis TaxID=45056 RepID=A0A0W0R4M4_9GAMM|nr:anthranilate synthase component I [Legionella adelaidensis]KTC65993.1 anthranilate synthase [Legionella adelaidensis]VEH86317.1 anthranilate synthase (glutamine amidotransferase) component I [Legionella adelaidensis]